MAFYPTFVVVNCELRKPILTTSSARKAYKELQKGFRVEVWINNNLCAKLYEKDKQKRPNVLSVFIEDEKEYIRQKQKMAEERNQFRKLHRMMKTKTG